MKRSHIPANVAPCLVTLGKQINTGYPKRDKRSDGIWPSAAHSKASPDSDHERGNAKDFSDHLLPGNESAYWDIWSIVLSLVASRDPRISYIIHDNRIWTPSKGWRDYASRNPHKTHAHISIKESLRNDARPWRITAPKPATKPDARELLVVTADRADVHKGPGPTTTSLVTIIKGGRVRNLDERRDPWLKVTVTTRGETYTGWVHKDHVK